MQQGSSSAGCAASRLQDTAAVSNVACGTICTHQPTILQSLKTRQRSWPTSGTLRRPSLARRCAARVSQLPSREPLHVSSAGCLHRSETCQVRLQELSCHSSAQKANGMSALLAAA